MLSSDSGEGQNKTLQQQKVTEQQQQQNRTKQNGTEQNRTERNGTEQEENKKTTEIRRGLVDQKKCPIYSAVTEHTRQ